MLDLGISSGSAVTKASGYSSQRRPPNHGEDLPLLPSWPVVPVNPNSGQLRQSFDQGALSAFPHEQLPGGGVSA